MLQSYLNHLAELLSKSTYMSVLDSVTILRDRETRISKGVAWIQYVDRESAEKAIQALNGTKVDKFTIKVQWAKDNGRGGEFIKKRKYTKAKYCFECGACISI